MGCSPDEFENILDCCLKNDKIILEGFYSHLANSDDRNVSYNDIQINRFKNIIKSNALKDYNLKIHLLSSGGLFNFKDLKYNIIRSGLSVYGISPLGYPHEKLKPVMTLKAPIVLNKKNKKRNYDWLWMCLQSKKRYEKLV